MAIEQRSDNREGFSNQEWQERLSAAWEIARDLGLDFGGRLGILENLTKEDSPFSRLSYLEQKATIRLGMASVEDILGEALELGYEDRVWKMVRAFDLPMPEKLSRSPNRRLAQIIEISFLGGEASDQVSEVIRSLGEEDKETVVSGLADYFRTAGLLEERTDFIRKHGDRQSLFVALQDEIDFGEHRIVALQREIDLREEQLGLSEDPVQREFLKNELERNLRKLLERLQSRRDHLESIKVARRLGDEEAAEWAEEDAISQQEEIRGPLAAAQLAQRLELIEQVDLYIEAAKVGGIHPLTAVGVAEDEGETGKAIETAGEFGLFDEAARIAGEAGEQKKKELFLELANLLC